MKELYLLIFILFISCKNELKEKKVNNIIIKKEVIKIGDDYSNLNNEKIVTDRKYQEQSPSKVLIPQVIKKYFLPDFNTIVNNLFTHHSNYKKHNYCEVDCCTEVTKNQKADSILYEQFTDCGDNGFYVNRYLFVDKVLILRQELSSFGMSQNNQDVFLEDVIYTLENNQSKLKRRAYTTKEFKSDVVKEYSLIPEIELNQHKSSSISQLDELFSKEDIIE
ncbi:hypothetical protein [Flammeovirga sp. SJP92]|uniref:hypothetical protein n=1 Tax=Flammeovirga sp. SJP92 TaxID=1775430 RepID=UPI000786CD00|nr:hypothetical protein [Flammeovirga sp. SJP92]KXX71063.1 hypothetical protein AVL50_10705 [Flammeovirga sp. SJP92]